MSYRKLLPRVEIRKLDEKPGTYPSVLRTGDPTRKGRKIVYFDDTSTILFAPSYYEVDESTIISWPSTLPLNGNIQTDFTSSITTWGTTIKESVGTLNNLPTFVEAPGPFKEEGMPEQIESLSDFFLTGTNIENVGFGLSSKLKSKVIIRIKLTIDSQTILQASKASIYYYNSTIKTFEEISAGNVGPANDSSGISSTYPCMDTKMFGPFGNFALSSSQFVPYYGIKSVSKVITSLGDSLQYLNNTASILGNDLYSPSANNRLLMEDYISHPFVIEKAVFDVPIEAGASWFADRTQFMPNGPYDNVPDAGGPCITFSLMGVNATGKRDLILSATMIPAGDDISGTIDFVSSSNNYRAIYGFNSFAKASAVVPMNSDGTFSGSVIIPGTANVRNSILSYGAPTNAGRQWSASTFKESYIGAVDPFGRGSSNDPCGRSIYGKEFTAPQLNNTNIQSINRKIFGEPPTNTNYYPEIWSYDSNTPSPYLIFPKDNLIVAISKHRPVISVSASYISNRAPTGSHDIKINTGSVYITLFGSLLRAGIESNNGHNPNATSNVVHEIIGGDPIYDEYDIFYRDELRNCYVTDYISGSISDSNSPRGKWRSSLDSNATTRLIYANRTSDKRRYIYHLVSFRRHAEANSTTERFYDSLVPPIDEFLKRGRSFGRMYGWNIFDGSSGQNRKMIVVNLDSNQVSSLYLDHSSVDWSRSFPFEPKYSQITRAITQKFFARNFLAGSSFVSWLRYVPMNDNIVVKVGTATDTIRVGMDKLDSSYIGLKNEVAMKLIYGIGSFNNFYNNGNKTFGASDRPEMIENVFSNGYAGVEIRGWKYGLINGLEQYSKSLYRRDKYGQHRDMLEQRLDTKYFINVKDDDISSFSLSKKNSISFTAGGVVNIKFVNLSGSLVRPEETYSSNLSFEATSSLPYFDGYVRNREEPINSFKVQQFQYMG